MTDGLFPKRVRLKMIPIFSSNMIISSMHHPFLLGFQVYLVLSILVPLSPLLFLLCVFHYCPLFCSVYSYYLFGHDSVPCLFFLNIQSLWGCNDFWFFAKWLFWCLHVNVFFKSQVLKEKCAKSYSNYKWKREKKFIIWTFNNCS